MNPLSNHQAGMAQHHEYETRYGRAGNTIPKQKATRRTGTGILTLVLRLFA